MRGFILIISALACLCITVGKCQIPEYFKDTYHTRYDIDVEASASGFSWSKTFASHLSPVIWFQKLEMRSSEVVTLTLNSASQQSWSEPVLRGVNYIVTYRSSYAAGSLTVAYTPSVTSEWKISLFLVEDGSTFIDSAGSYSHAVSAGSSYQSYDYWERDMTVLNYGCMQVILEDIDVFTGDEITIKRGLFPVAQWDHTGTTATFILPYSDLIVEFTSDIDTNGRGFIVEYYGVTCALPTGVISGTVDGSVSGSITEVSYPGSGADSYSNNVNQRWDYSLEPGYDVLVSIPHLQTERNYDKVQIYGGGVLHGELSGRQVDYLLVVRHTALSITFSSDGSNVGKGFYFKLQRVIAGSYPNFPSLSTAYPPTTTTTTTTTTATTMVSYTSPTIQTITSQNYPSAYPNSHSQSATITGNIGGSICLHVQAYSLESCCDHLKVVRPDLTQFDIESTGVYCYREEFISVTFSSDHSVSRTGFLSRATFTGAPENSDEGTITLNNYNNNEFRMWTIESSKDYITLTVLEFETESNNDVLRVFAESGAQWVLVASWSGSIRPPHNKQGFSHPRLLLVFITDTSVTYSGFNIQYNTVDGPESNGLDFLSWLIPVGASIGGLVFFIVVITGCVIGIKTMNRTNNRTNQAPNATVRYNRREGGVTVPVVQGQMHGRPRRPNNLNTASNISRANTINSGAAKPTQMFLTNQGATGVVQQAQPDTLPSIVGQMGPPPPYSPTVGTHVQQPAAGNVQTTVNIPPQQAGQLGVPQPGMQPAPNASVNIHFVAPQPTVYASPPQPSAQLPLYGDVQAPPPPAVAVVQVDTTNSGT